MSDESELERTARLLREANLASENAMRLMGQSPGMKAVQSVLNSPALRLMREYQNSPAMKLMQQYQNSPAARLQRQKVLEQHKLITASYDDSLLKRISDIHKQHANLLPDLNIARRSLLPASALQDAVKQITLATSTNLIDFSITDRYSSQLRKVMSSMESPWVSLDAPSLSLQGIGVLTALSDTIQHRNPFEEPARELVDHYLGEAIELDEADDEIQANLDHIDAGMDAGLVSLSAPETGEVLELTGFKLIVPYAPMPKPVTSDGSTLYYDPAYHAFIIQIEQQLRAHVDAKMKNEFGEKWIKARISSSLQDKWIGRRETGVSKGEPEFTLIHYADLIDLKDIIIGNKTWPSLFSNVFGVKEHFMTMMDRLYAVRNPLSHSRPISNGQRLHLHIEGVAILKALGVKVLEH